MSLANNVLLLLECCCEGHYAEMQDFLRVQPSMRTQVNVVIDLVNSLLVLEGALSSQTISLTCQLYQTLTELVQGPCPGNQRFLAGTNLCDVAVRFMHGAYPDCETADVIELKLLCLKLLLAMVEGVQSETIPRRIAYSLDYRKLVAELDSAYELAGGERCLDHGGSRMSDEERSLLQLGFYFFLLIRTLAKHTPSILHLCKARARSYPFFARNTGTIEIVRLDRTLEEVYFPVPILFHFLSEKSKQQLEWEVDRSTPQKRVEDFVRRSAGMIHEMRHNERISHIGPLHLLSSHAEALQTSMFYLSVLINVLILLFTYPETEDEETGAPGAGYWNVRFEPRPVEWAVSLLGSAQMVCSGLALAAHCISTLPLTLRSAWHRRGVSVDFTELWPLRVELHHLGDEEGTHKSGGGGGNGGGGGTGGNGGSSTALTAAQDSRKDGGDGGGGGGDASPASGEEEDEEAERVRHAQLVRRVLCWTPWLLLLEDRWLCYYLGYIGIVALGLLYLPFCFVITLLDIVVRSRLLQKVIEAVTVNSESLTLTFILVGVVIYHFTVVGQLFFLDDFTYSFLDSEGNRTYVDMCSSTSECLMNTVYLGMSYEGLAEGLKDYRQKLADDPENAHIRWFVDLTFFIAVIVMLLNIIFGIVIDTFAQQRDLQNQIKDNMENVCFVCGLDRNTFDRKHPIGFEYHTEHEHNIWHYLSFMIYLRTKRETEHTGPESFVNGMLEAKDLSFFPILKTSSMKLEDEVSNASLLWRIEHLSRQLADGQERLESSIETSVEKAIAAIDADK
jgi:hypothetical protein